MNAMPRYPPDSLSRLATTIMAVLLLLLLLAPSPGSRADGGQSGAFCVPDGWQSSRSVTRGGSQVGGGSKSKPTITRSLGDVIYSSSLQKLWIDDFMIGGGGVPTTRLYDYPGKILYTVHRYDEDQNQTCTKTPLLSPFQPWCVPVNATMTKYKSYYGATSPYLQYFMEFAGKLNDCDTACDVNYRVSLTREYQTPLFQQVWGKQNGERFFQTSEFYNSTIWGSLPPAIFTPPHVCDNVSLLQVPRPGVTGHMTVTVGDCALIEEVTYDLSMKGVSAVDNVQYFNQTLHVEDSVFTIPHNCIYVPPDDTNHHANRHWTHRMPRYFH
ncbi:hypothetical protein ACOMHN_013059 [Nucella lapillus]